MNRPGVCILCPIIENFDVFGEEIKKSLHTDWVMAVAGVGSFEFDLEGLSLTFNILYIPLSHSILIPTSSHPLTAIPSAHDRVGVALYSVLSMFMHVCRLIANRNQT